MLPCVLGGSAPLNSWGECFLAFLKGPYNYLYLGYHGRSGGGQGGKDRSGEFRGGQGASGEVRRDQGRIGSPGELRGYHGRLGEVRKD